MKQIITIGGGAAGMFAAAVAAERGQKVILLEKNGRLGKKLLITGKGRCNITNSAPPDVFIDNVTTNAPFLYSAFYGLDANAVVTFFERLGVKTKVERGNRVFPVSDKAEDVVDALRRNMLDNKVDIRLNERVEKLLIENGKATGVISNGKHIQSDSVIIATGGLSFPETGSTGDGYRFARDAGHTVTDLYPSLVPLRTKETWPKKLQGLTLKNVEITVRHGRAKLFRDFGEMLFTHYGVSGPIILSASCLLKGLYDKGCVINIDLKPALTHDELDARILRDFAEYNNCDFKNSLGDLLPKAMIPVFVELSEIPADKKIRDITRDERKAIGRLLKGLTLTVNGNEGYAEAVITAGGVSVDEINSSTMESKLINGLYFAGEVMDVEGFTGGFNLQIAFSTGYLAGRNC
jgi:hypothetical protein